MVYIEELAKKYKVELLADKTVQAICYFYVADKQNLPKKLDSNLGDEESLAVKGYLGIKPTDEEIQVIIGRKPIKQLDYTKNIFKLLGIHLASGGLISEKVKTKFNESHLKYKYMISRVLPEYLEQLKKHLQTSDNETPYSEIFSFMFLNQPCEDIERFVSQLTSQEVDVIDLLLIEDLRQNLIAREFATKYQNLTALEMIRQVLLEFGNSVKKITRDRRKGHDSFQINDEYDVQDLLYVMLKPLFPKLTIEDPVQKVGMASTIVDLSVREEGIIVEAKMIKRTDSDEKKFISQLKNDIESYYIYPCLKELLVFVYDPENKTNDIQNFYSLNGMRENKGIRFNVEVFVGN